MRFGPKALAASDVGGNARTLDGMLLELRLPAVQEAVVGRLPRGVIACPTSPAQTAGHNTGQPNAGLNVDLLNPRQLYLRIEVICSDFLVQRAGKYQRVSAVFGMSSIGMAVQ